MRVRRGVVEQEALTQYLTRESTNMKGERNRGKLQKLENGEKGVEREFFFLEKRDEET